MIKRSAFLPLPEKLKEVEISGAGRGDSKYHRGLWLGTEANEALPCEVWRIPGITIWVDDGGSDVVHFDFAKKMAPEKRALFREWAERGDGWADLRATLEEAGVPIAAVERYGAKNDEALEVFVQGGIVVKVKGPGKRSEDLIGLHWEHVSKELEDVTWLPMVRLHRRSTKGLRSSLWEAAQVLAHRCVAAAQELSGDDTEAGVGKDAGAEPVWQAHPNAQWMRQLTPSALAEFVMIVCARIREWLIDPARPLAWYVAKFATRNPPQFGGGLKVRSVQGTADRSCVDILAGAWLQREGPLTQRVEQALANKGLAMWRPLELSS